MSAEIETERLVLRPHRLSDFEAMAAMWAEPEVARFISGQPSTTEESWLRLQRYAGHWPLFGFGYWALIEKESGRYLGDGGFMESRRGFPPPFDAPEQGWAIAGWAQGKGYAREGCEAMLAWAEAHFRRRDFVCMIAPENTPSLKLAGRLGYREYARAEYRGAPVVLFRRA
ncbi:MAG: GNAT family N-acetyltransferase [Hyphomonadaceae bacterium]|nr:GNAT family N-acetyltransferase [Hyphomonadaceae bacterium]MBX3510128.1 GNAT family N-acetyltransferase [Hyphomonadaceae bacterium]